MAAPSSSSPFFGIREDDLRTNIHTHMKQQQISEMVGPGPASSTGGAPPSGPLMAKKKRNLPGTPNPDAEVVALSPKTLMATNRFICEVCKKGFQREQNLQLHRRGHNLPWKLRQKSTKEVKRKVYLCPEPTCVHHDRSRALGDLTGIKKHFSRKHGEKKWKCDKCSKRYAVQSDWKAHSKTCGTREYRCDCGTLFSRRDSFITHRAFCDALAQESARIPTGMGINSTYLYLNNGNGNGNGNGISTVSLANINQMNTQRDQNHASNDVLRLGSRSGSQFGHLVGSNSPTVQSGPSSNGFFFGQHHQQDHHFQDDHPLLHNKPFHGGLMQPPDLQASSSNAHAGATNLFNLGFFSNSTRSSSSSQSNHLLMSDQFNSGSGSVNNEQGTLFSGSLIGAGGGDNNIYSTSLQNDSLLPQMSATALLQKAAQMGSTTSAGITPSSLPRSTKPSELSMTHFAGAGDHGSIRSQIENENNFQDLMNSLANGNAASMFGVANSGTTTAVFGNGGYEPNRTLGFDGYSSNFGEVTDDTKLHQSMNPARNMAGGGSDGLTRDFLGVAGMMRRDQQHNHHGLDIGSFDSKLKSNTNTRTFQGGNLQ